LASTGKEAGLGRLANMEEVDPANVHAGCDWHATLELEEVPTLRTRTGQA